MKKIIIINQYANAVQVRLVDLTGREMMPVKAVIGTYEMKVGAIAGGAYILQVTDPGTKKTFRKLLLKK